MASLGSVPAINGTASIMSTSALSDPNSIEITLTFDPNDPLNQTLTLLDPAMVPVSIDLADFTDLQSYVTTQGVSVGVQLGMTLLMLLTVALITSPTKRKTPLFACNIAALLFITLRNLFLALYFVSPINSPYVYFMQSPWLVPMENWRMAIAGSVFKTLFMFCIEGSLVLQMKALLVTARRGCRMVILGSAYMLAIAVAVLYTVLLVVSATQIMMLQQPLSSAFLASIALINFFASMIFFCGVTTTILTRALWSRKKMGLKQFSAMNIITIMVLNTMIVPTMLGILGLLAPTSIIGAINLTLTAICLPLSSLWAASHNPPSTAGVFAAAAQSNTGSEASPQHGYMIGTTHRSTLMHVRLLLGGEGHADHRGRSSKNGSGPSPLESIFSSTSLHDGQTTGLGIYVGNDQTRAIELV